MKETVRERGVRLVYDTTKSEREGQKVTLASLAFSSFSIRFLSSFSAASAAASAWS